MITFIIQGIIMGLTLSIMIGPVFFELIQIGIEKGFRAALLYSFGVWCSDTLYVLITYFGVLAISNFLIENHEKIAILGGSIIIFIGIQNLLSKKWTDTTASAIETQKPLELITIGFIINLFNPFNVFFWSAIASQLHIVNQTRYVIVYYLALFAMLMLTDVFKAYFALKIKHRINANTQLFFKKMSGIALVCFGLFMLFKG